VLRECCLMVCLYADRFKLNFLERKINISVKIK
jgi:hypothetical protein